MAETTKRKSFKERYWMALLSFEDKEIAELLAKRYYNYKTPKEAVRQALRNELDRLEYRELEKRRQNLLDNGRE